MDTLRSCFCCGVMLLATAASSAPAGESILVPVADGAIFDQGPFDGIGDSDGISDDSDGTLQVDDFNEGTFVTVYDGFAAANGDVIEIDVTRFIRAFQRRHRHYVGFSFRTNVDGFFRAYGSLDTDQPINLVVVQ